MSGRGSREERILGEGLLPRRGPLRVAPLPGVGRKGRVDVRVWEGWTVVGPGVDGVSSEDCVDPSAQTRHPGKGAPKKGGGATTLPHGDGAGSDLRVPPFSTSVREGTASSGNRPSDPRVKGLSATELRPGVETSNH